MPLVGIPNVLVVRRVECQYLYKVLPVQVLSDGSRKCAFVRNRKWAITCSVNGNYTSSNIHSASVTSLRNITKIPTPDGVYESYSFPDLTIGGGISRTGLDGIFYKSVPDYDWRVGVVQEAEDPGVSAPQETLVQFLGREDYYYYLSTITISME